MIVVLVAGLTGLLAWTLTEYVMHRFAMHGHVDNPLGAEHRRHHRDPLLTDARLRTLGHLAIWILAALLAWALSSIIDTSAAVGLAAGWAAGYSAYELLHWRSHHRQPATPYTRWLKARHDAHHRGGPHRNIGVTTSMWDHVFSTSA